MEQCTLEFDFSPASIYDLSDPRIPERIRKKISVRDIPRHHLAADKGPCWIWTAFKNPKGYGRVTYKSRNLSAHEAVFFMLIGPKPEGRCLDHLCRNRSCCNPQHLEPVTMRENIMRGDNFMAANIHKTHCPSGHPYSQENTYLTKDGRACRECHRIRSNERYARLRGKAKSVLPPLS